MTDSLINDVKSRLQNADAVVVGAGSGLSTSAGFTYSGERFNKYFCDFEAKYGFNDMYTGGFADFESLEEYLGYWSRFIYINRYLNAPIPVYEEVLRLVKNKEYFALTTNVDHCFQKALFDKSRLFYTQGDYGLWQCSEPCHKKNYDNKESVIKMLASQNLIKNIADKDADFCVDKDTKMSISKDLIPYCPVCHKPMTMNLRCDNTFVEDEGWHKASKNYEGFLNKYKKENIVYLELGVGANTPGIIKYPFWSLTYSNRKACYICINKGEAVVPHEIKKQSICINDDIYEVLKQL